jgi:hypothetical protein
MCDPIHTTKSEVMYTNAYVHACRHIKYKHECMLCTYTYLHSSAQCNNRNIPCTNVPHYYALMRAGYVLHSLECLERGVVGKHCRNMLRSLIAYGVVIKTVHTYVCEKSDTAYVRSSRCAIPYTQPRARSYTLIHTRIRACRHIKYNHACMPCTYTFTPVHNAIVYTMHKRAPLLRSHASRLCTALT